MKALITTIPFGEASKKALNLLRDSNIEFDINPYGRKISEIELANIIHEYDVLIAGTEPISKMVINNAKNLKLIARVGSGIENIDTKVAHNNNILITNTPDTPSSAVAEFTLGLILSLIRNINISSIENHQGKWVKFIGRNLNNLNIGILGLGRIGYKLSKILTSIGVGKIYYYDLEKKAGVDKEIQYLNSTQIFKKADLISCHLPLNDSTKNFINKNTLSLMKKGSYVINTSRGEVVNENDLYDALLDSHIAGAALDVFCDEPYFGKLSNLKNCIITSHMSSLTIEARAEMEYLAASEVLNLKKNKGFKNLVLFDDSE